MSGCGFVSSAQRVHIIDQCRTVLCGMVAVRRQGQNGPAPKTPEQQKTFEASKKLLTSNQFVTRFDPNFKLILACDASKYGIGAMLAHCMEDSTEKPTGHASPTLTTAERNYSKLEKEGFACIFGVKKFHDYLFGQSFEMVTDHKQLLGLLKEDKETSHQASARIKRWSLSLSGCEYTLKFRRTTDHGNTDRVEAKQQKQKQHHDLRPKDRKFKIGDKIYY